MYTLVSTVRRACRVGVAVVLTASLSAGWSADW
jgi:hypothetical protein